MEGKRFIHTLRLENFLSYGSEGEEIELQPLNILIGANTSGKSNLIEAIGILKATPTDLPAPFRQGGGISEFLWKGGQENPVSKIRAIVNYPEALQPLHYQLMFTSTRGRLDLIDEVIENQYQNSVDNIIISYYRYNSGYPDLMVQKGNYLQPYGNYIHPENLMPDQSILSQRKDPELYPELSYLGSQFSLIGLYREWHIGRNSEIRKNQKPDLPAMYLLENGSNLGILLNNLKSKINRQIIEKLKKFYDAVEDFNVNIYAGTLEIVINEDGLTQPIPATRLSDGTLRYLFLTALLLNPTPPPLICIEEPEIGLHPDILPTIAEMLIEASQRTQIIVTTHSDALVSALSEYPESVLVCERDEKGSHLHQLEADKLKNWLEKYTLGDLWRMGEIGGNRW